MLKEIIENYPDNEILKMDGFDDAVIGYHEQSKRVIYSVKKVIDIIYNEMQNADDFTLEDAFEHFSFNIQSTWVGEFTPILCYDIF
tara:strand:- start:176 stop:433 length:258 start_codon:yes stop_codon:yes gene_type:complete